MNKEGTPRTLLDDPIFRWIVIISTAISFAATAGVAASFRMDQRMFVWHWSIPIWMLVGVIAAVYLWKLALRLQKEPTRNNKRNFILFSISLVLAGIVGFLWPVLFVAQEKFADLRRGLVTAGIFLGVCGGVFYAFMRSFHEPEQEPEKKTPTPGS
jgi:hypothetical protein